jgi:RNA polymerase sigma-70 factor (ECF subfamily)
LIINLLNPIISGASSKTLSDEEAIDIYLETQNVNYFNILYDRYSKKVFGKCYSLLKSEAKAEDAAQEVFVKVLLNLSKFTGRSKFSTWLYSITYNFCIDAIRKNKKNVGVLVEDISIFGEEVEDEIEDSQIMETNVYRLKEVLNIIPAGDKAILLMKYQDEFSIKEICNIIDKSESAVKMKIKRAKERFVKTYKELY